MKRRAQTEWHVPIHLIIHAVKYKLDYELQLYLYLKCSSYGIVKLNKKLLADCSIALDVCTKTINSRIIKLIAMGWIAKFKTNNYIQIRSFDKVCRKCNVYSRSAIVLSKDFLADFKAYIGGAIYTHFYFASKKRIRRRDAAIMDTAIAPAQGSFYGSPVAINGVAKCVEISISKAARLKSSAVKAGFINVTSNNEQLLLNSDYQTFVHKATNNCGKFFPIHKTLYCKHPDLIIPILKKSYRRH